MRLVFPILLLLLSASTSYAACGREEICEMIKKMDPFSILDQCPEAGPLIVQCKKVSTKVFEDLPEPEFVDNKDGTVTDTVNKLLWLKKGVLKPMNLKDAEKYAATANDAGKNGWRLPTLQELKTLMAPEKVANTSGKNAWINPVFDDDQGHHYWTTTNCEEVTEVEDRYQKKTCQQGQSAVWLVHFNIGALFWHHTDATLYNTWLVQNLK